jgi:hypothetical protein
MPMVDEFDALLSRRVQVWSTAARILGESLGRVYAYADVACEVSSGQLSLLADPTLQQLENLGLLSWNVWSNLAHGLATTLDACTEDGTKRALLIASTMPNTVLDEKGRPRMSIPADQEIVAATKAAMEACAAGGLRLNTVTMAEFPDDPKWASPFTAEAFLTDLTTGAGGCALTLQPQDGLSTVESALNRWYG